jgi:hypothetical protein
MAEKEGEGGGDDDDGKELGGDDRVFVQYC